MNAGMKKTRPSWKGDKPSFFKEVINHHFIFVNVSKIYYRQKMQLDRRFNKVDRNCATEKHQ